MSQVKAHWLVIVLDERFGGLVDKTFRLTFSSHAEYFVSPSSEGVDRDIKEKFELKVK